MIFLLLFGIFAGVYQLWLFAYVVAETSNRPAAKVRVGILPGIISVILIGTWFMLT